MQCLIQSFFYFPQAGNTFMPFTAVNSSTVLQLFLISHNKTVTSSQTQQGIFCIFIPAGNTCSYRNVCPFDFRGYQYRSALSESFFLCRNIKNSEKLFFMISYRCDTVRSIANYTICVLAFFMLPRKCSSFTLEPDSRHQPEDPQQCRMPIPTERAQRLYFSTSERHQDCNREDSQSLRCLQLQAPVRN